jgi:hypothetical protein
MALLAGAPHPPQHANAANLQADGIQELKRSDVTQVFFAGKVF